MDFKLVLVEPADDGKHKFVALFKKKNKNGTDRFKRVKFGAAGSYSYIDGADDSIRAAYRARHGKEDFSSPFSRASLSYFITWGDSHSLRKNIEEYKKMYNV